MKIFSFLKNKPEELVLTRKVLIEKWFEGGVDVIESLTNIILQKVAPALKEAMIESGFDTVEIGREHWYISYLSHKKLLSGKHAGDFNHIPSEYCRKINSFESYSIWAERAEKMVEKISEIKQQVEEMKRRRDVLSNMIRILPETK